MNAAASLTNCTSPGSRRSLSAAFGTPVSGSEFTLKHWHSGWVYGRPTQDLADVVTVLGDFIQPPLNIYERLWICHVVNYDDAVGVSVVPGDTWSGRNWWPQRWRCSARGHTKKLGGESFRDHYVEVMVRNLSCPAVSQICSFTRSPSISTVRILKSTPMVVM